MTELSKRKISARYSNLLKTFANMMLNKLRTGLKIANCKDPTEIALRLTKEDDRILRALSNGTKKVKKTYQSQ